MPYLTKTLCVFRGHGGLLLQHNKKAPGATCAEFACSASIRVGFFQASVFLMNAYLNMYMFLILGSLLLPLHSFQIPNFTKSCFY